MDTNKLLKQLNHISDHRESYTKEDLMRELDKIIIEHCYDKNFYEIAKTMESKKLN